MHPGNAQSLTGESSRAHCAEENIWGTNMGASVARGGRSGRFAAWRDSLRNGTRRAVMLLGGATLIVGACLLLLALVSYRPSDPSLNTAAAGPVHNWIGPAGAWASSGARASVNSTEQAKVR